MLQQIIPNCQIDFSFFIGYNKKMEQGSQPKQKLYCYVDETGQDTGSEFFIVVAVVSDKEQNLLRNQLLEIESLTKIGLRKWHKAQSQRKKDYLQLLLKRGIGKGEVYFGHYKKPLPFFLPVLETVEKAIFSKAKKDYKAIVYIDGIDKKKAIELTNALRFRKIKLGMIKSRRDESEPLIRLADRWAGCIRAAFLGKKDEERILRKAKSKKYLREI